MDGFSLTSITYCNSNGACKSLRSRDIRNGLVPPSGIIRAFYILRRLPEVCTYFLQAVLYGMNFDETWARELTSADYHNQCCSYSYYHLHIAFLENFSTCETYRLWMDSQNYDFYKNLEINAMRESTFEFRILEKVAIDYCVLVRNQAVRISSRLAEERYKLILRFGMGGAYAYLIHRNRLKEPHILKRNRKKLIREAKEMRQKYRCKVEATLRDHDNFVRVLCHNRTSEDSRNFTKKYAIHRALYDIDLMGWWEYEEFKQKVQAVIKELPITYSIIIFFIWDKEIFGY